MDVENMASLLLTLFGGVVVAILYLKRSSSRLPLPPGPKKLPLVGNLFQMPRHSEWETYTLWSKEHNSDIIHLNVAGTSIILLSSVQAAEDLLHKRSAIYSDRPRACMFNDLIEGDCLFREYWRESRRLFHLQADVEQTHRLLRLLLKDPDSFAEHFEYVIDVNIVSMTYGLAVTSLNDPLLTSPRKAVSAMNAAALPGRFLVDFIPALKYVPSWFPGGGFKIAAATCKQLIKEMVDPPFEVVRRAMEAGTARPSFVSNTLRSIEEDSNKHYAENNYQTRTDTTRVTLLVFILAMLLNPDVQRKAQEEIDSVVGSGHLPDYQDEEVLPYVSAVLKESLRWRPALPSGLPHFVAIEDVYRGYRIPAGSVILANSWAMLHDENVYPEPEAFKPERFLLPNGKLNPAVEPDAAFGWGRRVCPGRGIGWNMLWIMAASLLAVFDITKAIGEDGEVIEPTLGHTSELTTGPLPFKCSIKPRSKQAADLILSTSNS
ncbi:cytochrome P450 [Mycena rebaudengoi]|nr:cytochrome P450 [Mycena rebaudengoi]